MRTPPACSIYRWHGKGAFLLAAVLSLTLAPLDALAAPITHTVVIKAMQFSPQVLTVRAGDTVEWINQDLFAHDATSVGKGFQSTVMAPHMRWKFTARQKGTFSYRCTLHPMMKALVIVK